MIMYPLTREDLVDILVDLRSKAMPGDKIHISIQDQETHVYIGIDFEIKSFFNDGKEK